MFDGTGDLKVHLRTYCDKLVGVVKDERIRMKLFIRSLTEDVLSWYISQNPKKWVNWNLKKKPTESFREYATRWRYEATKVRPALEEEQMNKFFVRAQDPQYYERLMVIENYKFSDIINIIITYPDEPTTVTCNETTQRKDSDLEDLEEDVIPEEITETVNLGDSESVKETRISIHLSPLEKEEYIQFLKEYEDIFAWSYDDMIGMSISIVAHKLPIDPMCPPVKQKLRKFKPALSLKTKEEVTKYNLKLNPAKCAFEVSARKLLGFIISRRGIELDPSKVKAIQDFPPPKNKKDKDARTSWTEECEKAFDKIKEYLSKPPDLVPPEHGRPLLLYLSVLDGAFGCVLGQHDETRRKKHAIYYMSKKFTPYEARYSLLERTYCALTWIDQRLRHYFCAYTTYLRPKIDPLKYIFQKPMPTGKLAKWQILLSEFDIIYVTQKAVKGKALADHLAGNPVDGEYEPLKTYFPDEEVSFVGEDITEAYDGWRMFFDGAANFKGVGSGAVLVSETGQHYPVSAKLRFSCTNNMVEYEACILGLRLAIDMNVQELLVIGDSDLMIKHKNSTTYKPQMNGVVEAANKNIKKILRKIVDNHKQWHEKLPFSLLGYRTTVRTSTGETPYLLVYGTEVVIPAEVEIPFFRIIQEAKLSDAKWIRSRYEQLDLIDGKRMNVPYATQGNSNRTSRQEQRQNRR
ncbi:uncharacterized protein [Nicotiana tomentosiformis]|uniref:uncharacterized protein n=1 Tax=Nicotiana tomentosiformis TaxID=4098 RepID=UPI00388CC0A6